MEQNIIDKHYYVFTVHTVVLTFDELQRKWLQRFLDHIKLFLMDGLLH